MMDSYYKLSFKDYLVERSLEEDRSGEKFKPKRGKAVQFSREMFSDLEFAEEVYNLVQTAYSSIGGHVKVTKVEDIVNNSEWDYWEGVDVHNDSDFDLVMFGQKTKFGIKFSGIGHDGSSVAKREYIKRRAEDLVKPGYFIEVSGKISDILINDYKVPIVTDEEDIEKVLGKNVNFSGKNPEDPMAAGDGWYVRKIGGHSHAKILLGRPKGI